MNGVNWSFKKRPRRKSLNAYPMTSTTASQSAVSHQSDDASRRPGVDVVVPCYNYGRYLRQCVESVLTQQGVNVRVLIIDDCSSDNTPEVGRALASEDHRVEYRRHETNRGHIATYNEGLFEWVSAEFNLLLSADDMLAPGALEYTTTLMVRDPLISLTYGRAVEFRGQVPTNVCLEGSPATRIMEGVDFIQFAFNRAVNPVPTPAAIVRTIYMRKVPVYDCELPHSADLLFWLNLAAVGRVGVVDSTLAFYRRHEHNMTYDHRGPAFGDLHPRLAAFEVFADSIQEPGAANAWRESCRRQTSELAICHAHRCAHLGRVADAIRCIRFARRTHADVRRARGWVRLAVTTFATSTLWAAVQRVSNGSKRNANCQTEAAAIIIGEWPEVPAASCEAPNGASIRK